MQPDRKMIFVHDWRQWESDRKRIVDQLSRYGFLDQDRMCISVSLDEAVILALEEKMNGHVESAAIGYSISARVFHLRVRFVGGVAPGTRSHEGRRRWLLAIACMSGNRMNETGTEVEMWRNNSTIARAEGRHKCLREQSRRSRNEYHT